MSTKEPCGVYCRSTWYPGCCYMSSDLAEIKEELCPYSQQKVNMFSVGIELCKFLPLCPILFVTFMDTISKHRGGKGEVMFCRQHGAVIFIILQPPRFTYAADCEVKKSKCLLFHNVKGECELDRQIYTSPHLEEMENIVSERDIWNTMLSLLPLRLMPRYVVNVILSQ